MFTAKSLLLIFYCQIIVIFIYSVVVQTHPSWSENLLRQQGVLGMVCEPLAVEYPLQFEKILKGCIEDLKTDLLKMPR